MAQVWVDSDSIWFASDEEKEKVKQKKGNKKENEKRKEMKTLLAFTLFDISLFAIRYSLMPMILNYNHDETHPPNEPFPFADLCPSPKSQVPTNPSLSTDSPCQMRRCMD